ncbi:MAG: chemotaxis protein [Burkholderiaceae bacterium]|nr:chemotaxis protein [Burkholderiaceae bacterium]
MRFTTRVFLCTAVPAAFFVAALGIGLWALQRTQAEFEHYIARDQALAASLTEMYAQGLQMGQAVRNVVIDPADDKARHNFGVAEAAFAEALEATLPLAIGTPLAARVEGLRALRETQARRQAEVLAQVKVDAAGAPALLREQETPAWRALRGELLALVKDARAQAEATHQQAVNAARTARTTVGVLLVAALAVAAALFTVLRRTLAAELGAEPAQARADLQRIADGDLSADDGASTAARGLGAELQRTRARLRELVGHVRRSTEQIDLATAEIAAGNQDLSRRTEQSASRVQETASSMEELTVTVRQSSASAQEADTLARQAADIARRGGDAVAQVVATMEAINQSSRQITEIVGVIDGIAFQTNILALNAAVEAARAGEQGRGFAVVAGEVRTLAQRSATAAREIKALIGASVDKVEAGAQSATEAGETMQQVVASVSRVSSAIGEISAAAGEQAGGIGLVGQAVTELDRSTQQNAALVEQSAAAAASLREQARQLTSLVSTFRLGATV